MFTHPELKEGEIFFTNTNTKGFTEMGWKTKRRGEIPYTAEGVVVEINDWSPVFIQEKELVESGVDLRTHRRAFQVSQGAILKNPN